MIGFIGVVAHVVGFNMAMSKVIGCTALMVTWWLNNAIPMGITGLAPIAVLPLLGVMDATEVSQIYFSNGIVICWSTILMASAVEKYKLNGRVATALLQFTSSSTDGGRSIICGFIAITGFLSMWLSNTATAALMLPLSAATITQLKKRTTASPHMNYNDILRLASAIDLGIAFSSSIGGTATITGTGSNLVLQGAMLSQFGEADQVTFFQWFAIAAPLAAVNLFILWLVLVASFTSTCSSSRWLLELPFYSQITNGSTHNILSSDSNNELTTTDDVDGGLDIDGAEGLYELGLFTGAGDSMQSCDQGGGDHRPVEEEEEEAGAKQAAPLNEDLSHKMPAITYPEVVVTLMFTLMAVLWMTRSPSGGSGWANKFEHPSYITDGTVAMSCCLLLFVIPSSPPTCCYYYWVGGSGSDRGPAVDDSSCQSLSERVSQQAGDCSDEEVKEDFRPAAVDSPDSNVMRESSTNQQLSSAPTSTCDEYILDWSDVQSINWNIIFLLGGAFALSSAFQESGLSSLLAEKITHDGPPSLTIMIAAACAASTTVTNVMSNVAASGILISALSCTGPAHGVHPLYVLAPVAMASSYAFLLPIGTPPNAIILTNGNVTLKQMFCVGLLLSACLYVTTVLYCLYFVPAFIYDIHSVSNQVLIKCGA